MIIEADVLKEWDGLRDVGDIGKIAEDSGIGRLTIQNAFSEGKCTETTFMAIAAYYKAKKERIADATK